MNTREFLQRDARNGNILQKAVCTEILNFSKNWDDEWLTNLLLDIQKDSYFICTLEFITNEYAENFYKQHERDIQEVVEYYSIFENDHSPLREIKLIFYSVINELTI